MAESVPEGLAARYGWQTHLVDWQQTGPARLLSAGRSALRQATRLVGAANGEGECPTRQRFINDSTTQKQRKSNDPVRPPDPCWDHGPENLCILWEVSESRSAAREVLRPAVPLASLARAQHRLQPPVPAPSGGDSADGCRADPACRGSRAASNRELSRAGRSSSSGCAGISARDPAGQQAAHALVSAGPASHAGPVSPGSI